MTGSASMPAASVTLSRPAGATAVSSTRAALADAHRDLVRPERNVICIIWRNEHAADKRLRKVVNRANVA
ncbi:hypothetical protein ACSCB1_41640 [Streptomyces europaeiscabiei]|uniref:hypothetical protein n=1 Tax=Streptomyces europaeiscabiei TaxID=146819 RepID=UPI0018FE93CF|nr:hypothetical protein [Streptomyces europaeiscabiei]